MSTLDALTRQQLINVAPTQLRAAAGGYLRHTVMDGRTCEICRQPETAPLCSDCMKYRMAFQGRLADAVGFMTYAVSGTEPHTLSQAGHILTTYKGGYDQEALTRVKLLAAVGALAHEACPGRLPGATPPTTWASVPSRQGRRQHQLRYIAEKLAPLGATEAILLHDGSPKLRKQVNPSSFGLQKELEPGTHVLLFEDTWTSGATLQSASVALKDAGAVRVSAFVLGRWIQPGWNDGAAFLDSLPDYDPAGVCPWTAGSCP